MHKIICAIKNVSISLKSSNILLQIFNIQHEIYLFLYHIIFVFYGLYLIGQFSHIAFLSFCHKNNHQTGK